MNFHVNQNAKVFIEIFLPAKSQSLMCLKPGRFDICSSNYFRFVSRVTFAISEKNKSQHLKNNFEIGNEGVFYFH